MNLYKISYKIDIFEISSMIEAKNKLHASVLASRLFKNDDHVPSFIKPDITSKKINVERIYKHA